MVFKRWNRCDTLKSVGWVLDYHKAGSSNPPAVLSVSNNCSPLFFLSLIFYSYLVPELKFHSKIFCSRNCKKEEYWGEHELTSFWLKLNIFEMDVAKQHMLLFNEGVLVSFSHLPKSACCGNVCSWICACMNVPWCLLIEWLEIEADLKMWWMSVLNAEY